MRSIFITSGNGLLFPRTNERTNEESMQDAAAAGEEGVRKFNFPGLFLYSFVIAFQTLCNAFFFIPFYP